MKIQSSEYKALKESIELIAKGIIKSAQVSESIKAYKVPQSKGYTIRIDIRVKNDE